MPLMLRDRFTGEMVEWGSFVLTASTELYLMTGRAPTRARVDPPIQQVIYHDFIVSSDINGFTGRAVPFTAGECYLEPDPTANRRYIARAIYYYPPRRYQEYPTRPRISAPITPAEADIYRREMDTYIQQIYQSFLTIDPAVTTEIYRPVPVPNGTCGFANCSKRGQTWESTPGLWCIDHRPPAPAQVPEFCELCRIPLGNSRGKRFCTICRQKWGESGPSDFQRRILFILKEEGGKE